ncbi:MAG: ABC transporter substrate-binding protein [Actinobacteria bacterium]|nr:ABC transporter substrate-binding protein [Actinomycetota bacterium]
MKFPRSTTADSAFPTGGNRPTWFTVVTAFVFGASLSGLLLMQIEPTTETASSTGPASGFIPVDPGSEDTGGSVSGGVSSGGGSGPATAAGPTAAGGGGLNVGGSGGASGGNSGASGEKAGLECKEGKNGGETDTGVTGDSIKLAANVVLDGPGSNFLSDSPTGMQAVVNKVNAAGGICGRQLKLTTVNDSWEAARGRTNIENFIADGNFALPVLPSSEGLSNAIDAGVIEKAGIPVIGTDGMRKEQYDAKGNASWVGPVATATVSQVRIMAEYGKAQLGAQKFGIVYDQKYKFGEEGEAAYKKYLKDKYNIDPGDVASQKLDPEKQSYQNEAQAFVNACGGPKKCDVVVLLLEPQTGIKWWTAVKEDGKGGKMTAGAQPLFNEKFARGCGDVCNGIWVWTGYNPAIGPNTAKPGIAEYISDVKAISPSIDITNQFLQGAYLGMKVFVKTLEDCSPNLTRKCVKERLDSLDYTSDFAETLTWRSGNHFANTGARAYAITYSAGSFSDFEDKQTGFRPDPTPGVVPE